MNLTTARSQATGRVQLWTGVKWGLLLVAIGGVLVILTQAYPVGVDWQLTFGRLWHHWDNPYAIRGLYNPGWIMLYLPHSALPLRLGNAVNLLLNVSVPGAVIYKYWGKDGPRVVIPLWVMLYTFPPFLDLVRANNVEWIPLLALLLPDSWLIATLAVKPQSIGGAALIRWKTRGFDWRLLIPTVALLIGSVILWGAWFTRLDWQVAEEAWAVANFSPFPYFVPLGVWMLWEAWQTDNEVLAGTATPLLVPYFAGYGIFPVLVLIATKYKREAFYLWVGLWLYFVLEGKRQGIL